MASADSLGDSSAPDSRHSPAGPRAGAAAPSGGAAQAIQGLWPPSRDTLTLTGILCIGALARLYRLDLTWYFLDQARDTSIASGIASGSAFPLLGPRIGWTDAYLGPLYFYLLSIPFLLDKDPTVAVAFVSLSNVLAIFLLYRFVREYFGPRPALYASALFAVFPLAIFSSRLVWHTGLLPVFSILLMRALYSVIVKEHSRALVPMIGLLAVVTQLHLTSLVLGVVVIIGMLLFRPRVRLVHALTGAAVFVLLYAPYLAYELPHRLENLRSLLRFALGPGTTSAGAFASVLKNVVTLFHDSLDGFAVEAPGYRLSVFSALYAVETLAVDAGILLCLYDVIRRRTAATVEQTAALRGRVLLLVWFFVPLVMLGTRRGVMWWYYLDPMYPSQFISAAIAFSTLSSLVFLRPGARRGVARAVACLVLLVVASQVYFLLAFQQTVLSRGKILVEVSHLSINRTASPFGSLTSLPLRHRREIVRVLVDEFGLSALDFRRRVHGPVLGLPDESEHLVRQLAAGHGFPRTDGAAASAHYVIQAVASAAPEDALRARRIGPYLIVEYRPHIDYEGWYYAVVLGEDHAHVPVDAWKPAALPAVDVGVALGDGRAVLWSGRLRRPLARADTRIAVSTVSDAPLEVVSVQINGSKAPRLTRRVQQTPLMLWRPPGWMMGAGWTSESVFELTGGLIPAGERLLIAVAGRGQLLGFDVYESGARPAAAGQTIISSPGRRPLP